MQASREGLFSITLVNKTHVCSYKHKKACGYYPQAFPQMVSLIYLEIYITSFIAFTVFGTSGKYAATRFGA